MIIQKRNFLCIRYVPYPSGAGLHVGRRRYTATDILEQMGTMYFAMGWDAFSYLLGNMRARY